MGSITLESNIRTSQDWLSSDMDGETVMMSIENGNYYVVTKVGTTIWEQIQNPKSVKEICNILMDKYEISQEKCETETISFLNQLAEEGIIVSQ